MGGCDGLAVEIYANNAKRRVASIVLFPIGNVLLPKFFLKTRHAANLF